MKSMYKDLLTPLVHTKYLLVYDDGTLIKEYQDTFRLFKCYRYNNIDKTTAVNVPHMLLTSAADLVLLCGHEIECLLNIARAITEYDPKIAITLVVEKFDNTVFFRELINIVTTVVYMPFDDETLQKKTLENITIEEFITAYVRDVKMINSILNSKILRLESGDLSEELFLSIANQLELIGRIFQYHSETKHLKDIFDELTAFLRTYEFEDVSIEQLEVFDYLTEILKDIVKYLNGFFIEKIFLDVYVFEDSLHDTIRFMIHYLLESEKLEGKLEYFYD